MRSSATVLRAQRIEVDHLARFAPYFVMLPHLHGTDGFFAAAFERRAAGDTVPVGEASVEEAPVVEVPVAPAAPKKAARTTKAKTLPAHG